MQKNFSGVHTNSHPLSMHLAFLMLQITFPTFPFPVSTSSTNYPTLFPQLRLSSLFLLSPSYSNNLPYILTNHPPDSSSFHCSLVSILPNQLRSFLNSRLSKRILSPEHPIFKTEHPSILDCPSRSSTPDLPNPSIPVSQSSNHTPCYHSQHSRVDCESRFMLRVAGSIPIASKIIFGRSVLEP